MNKLKAVFAVLFVLAAGNMVFAQSKAPLTVIASEGPAQVVVNGRVVGMANPSMTVHLLPGRYDLMVKKGGKPDFRQTVQLGPGGLTVQAQLGAPQQMQPQRIESKPMPPPVVVKQLFNLSITANAPGAQVAVNGSVIGRAPTQATLEAGNYQITVTAPGYDTYSASVQVNGNTSHAANLRQVLNRLTVSANVNGAEVFLNGVKAGNAPFAVDLAPGSYNIRIAAPGFQDYNAGIAMSGPQNLSVSLIPLFSTITVTVPAQIMNREHGNDRDRLDLYVDGVKQNGLSAQVPPGQRKIRVVSGSFSVESVLSVDAGRSYTIEPTLTLNIR